jgi:hypothetical protein
MARYNFQVKVGTYTGNGADSRGITDVGFRPHLVIVKGGSNIAPWRIRQMAGDIAAGFGGVDSSDRIQEMLNDGFQVGANAQVNANGTVYYYVAIRATGSQNHFASGRYIGDGTAARNITTGGFSFTPDLIFLKRADGGTNLFRTSEHAANICSYFTTTTDQSNRINSFLSGGFQIGSNAETNNSGSAFWYTVLREIPNIFVVGSYVGNGVDGRQIEVGFQPSAVFVKGNTGQQLRFKTSDMSALSAFILSTAAGSDDTSITAFNSTGFTIGTNAATNNPGTTYYWWALKAGDFSIPVERLAA